jgi:hypothetical protein
VALPGAVALLADAIIGVVVVVELLQRMGKFPAWFVRLVFPVGH